MNHVAVAQRHIVAEPFAVTKGPVTAAMVAQPKFVAKLVDFGVQIRRVINRQVPFNVIRTAYAEG